MLEITDRIRTATRLGIVVLVLLVPGGLATGIYTAGISADIGFSSRERDGTDVLRQVLVALVDTAAGRTPDLSLVRDAVDAQPDLGVGEVAAAVPAVGDGSANSRIATATALAALATEIGNSSNLILDPDLDSFYVMDAQVVQLPQVLMAAVQTSQRVAAGTDPQQAAAARAVLAGRLSNAADAIRKDVATAVANTDDGGLADRITTPVSALAERIDALGAQLTATIDNPGPGDLTAVAEAASAAVQPLHDALASLLDDRIGKFSLERALVLSVSIGGFLLALWFAAAVVWRTSHDVRQTVRAVTAIARADLVPRPLPEGGDEMGDIGRALIVARTRLQDQEQALVEADAAREQHLRASFLHQRQAEAQFQRRTQDIIDESTTVIAEELRQVTEKVSEVRSSSEVIDDRINAADNATSTVVTQARDAELVITSLEQSLRRVAQTAALVTGIAGQTRLLALNATIEAARAGHLGYGFTVVADEVKQLATHTAESTDQIIQTIHALEDDTTAVAQTIINMTEGIAAVGQAAVSLRVVAADQSTLMDKLTYQMNATLGRVEEMANLADRLERRTDQRIAAAGQVLLRPPGRQPINAALVNLSAGGMRCVLINGEQLVDGTIVDVELNTAAEDLSVRARVVNSVDSRHGMEIGLQILVTDDGLSRKLKSIAETMLAQAGEG